MRHTSRIYSCITCTPNFCLKSVKKSITAYHLRHGCTSMLRYLLHAIAGQCWMDPDITARWWWIKWCIIAARHWSGMLGADVHFSRLDLAFQRVEVRFASPCMHTCASYGCPQMCRPSTYGSNLEHFYQDLNSAFPWSIGN